MSVTKQKNGKWLVQVINREHNVRIRKTFSTKKEAKDEETAIRARIKRQSTPTGGIEKAMEQYLKGDALALKDYGSVASKARAILPYIHQKTFAEAGQVADNIKQAMLADGLKPATINRRLALLKRLANLAHDWGWIETPIARRIKLLPGEQSRHYYLTIPQVEELATACKETGSIIRIAAFTGLRRGEIFKLTPQKITPQFIVLDASTKTGKPRLVPIPEQVKTDIQNLTLPLDKALDYQLRKEFEAARVELNMTHIRFHDLRHTYASLLAQAGATLQLIGKAMGHSTPVMTARYAHLVSDNLLELADKFSKMS